MWSSIKRVALFCIAGVYAAPQIKYRATTTGISANEFSHFNLMAQYAGASYCPNNINGTSKTVNCENSGGYCNIVEQINPPIYAYFSLGTTQTTGFVAVDSTNKYIVVSIRGTVGGLDGLDFQVDKEYNFTSTSLCGTANTNDGCSIHTGFWASTNDAQSTVISKVKSALTSNPGYTVVVTGHSLGGAVAALLATALRNDGLGGTVVDLYTYGQPRLGSADISNYVQNTKSSQGTNNRITHLHDPVPQLPPNTELLTQKYTWDHYYPEYYITTSGINVQQGSITVVTGSLSADGGDSGDVADTATDLLLEEAGHSTENGPHDTYFEHISGCHQA